MQESIFDLNAELEESHWWFTGRRAIIRGIVESVFPPREGRRIIDIGCGTGANIASLADDYHVTGYDLSEKAISFAHDRFPGVDFVQDDAARHLERLKAQPGETFLLLNDVLEHISDDYEFLNRIVDSAPTRSRLLITVPADPRLWSSHDESHGHYRRYTSASLHELLLSAKLDIHLLTYFNAKLYPLVVLIRKTTAMLGTSFGASDSDLSMPPEFINRRLASTFASERDDILEALHADAGATAEPVFRRGVSLLALARLPARRDYSSEVE